MQRTRLRHWRRLSALLFVALLLVPIVFSGHRHANDVAQANTCATCVAVHHVPAAAPPVLATIAPVLIALRLPCAPPAMLTADARPLAVSRGPPLVPVSLPA